MATLIAPAHSEVSSEILRVENAQTDARVEAAICRQFGAKALLILPIYHKRAMAGVLEVFFGEAHAFQDREVRTYRLMGGLIEEAMSRAAQLEQEKNPTVELATTPRRLHLRGRSFATTVDLRRAQQTSMPSTSVAEPPWQWPGSCRYLDGPPCWRQCSCSKRSAFPGTTVGGS